VRKGVGGNWGWRGVIFLGGEVGVVVGWGAAGGGGGRLPRRGWRTLAWLVCGFGHRVPPGVFPRPVNARSRPPTGATSYACCGIGHRLVQGTNGAVLHVCGSEACPSKVTAASKRINFHAKLAKTAKIDAIKMLHPARATPPRPFHTRGGDARASMASRSRRPLRAWRSLRETSETPRIANALRGIRPRPPYRGAPAGGLLKSAA
jgi:hypothetical protein